MKILLVSRNLPPLVGGMERLNWHMAEELAKYAEITLVCPKEAVDHNPVNINSHGVDLKPLWKFLVQAGWKTIKVAKSWKPDIILAGSGLTAPLALIAARLTGAKSVCYIHGLDVAVKHPLYKILWHPAIRRMDKVIANSTATTELAKSIGVKEQRIGIVHPGVACPDKQPEPNTILQFRKKYALDDKTILLSVGRLTTRKGLEEFVRYSLPEIAQVYPDILLVVIGDAPKDSLYAKAQTPEKIQETANLNGVGNNIKFLGVITDREMLSAAYGSASVHVFPVKHIDGDPEGFGMVAIESAAHGLPTVGFATGGIIDAISDGRSGFLVKTPDYQELAKKIILLLDGKENMNSTCIEFSEKFSWDNFGKKILRQLKDKND